MALQPVVKRSVSADVFEQIAADVLSGELAPGSTLPSERQLAEALGVSRPAVREALQRLAAAGLVAVRQGDATTVLDYRRGAGLEVLPRLLIREGMLEPAVARSILEVRMHNGPKVAELAAARMAALDRESARATGRSGLPERADGEANASESRATGRDNRGHDEPNATQPGMTGRDNRGHDEPNAAQPVTTSRDNRADGGSRAAEPGTEYDQVRADLERAVAALTAETDPVVLQRHALEFWDHVVDAADSIVFRLMFNMLRAAYEPALAALAPVMSAEVGNAEGYRELAAAIVAGRPKKAADKARALLEPATTALIEALGGR
ncbi:FadR/GntR family transcriptional regulator [Nocardia amikacinitolerans]|uniref:FadR/GntR family transcriptional regulator n=1 Tax=Nocardia amikacinitolerans TaxID=756689 RepID=UPI0020A2A47F|nr:GntR family transcriptional regulator [Nocardia amikacinitolerans]MCP2276847.1 regulatory protein, gntR family [Nocardia amikacinitolerans]